MRWRQFEGIFFFFFVFGRVDEPAGKGKFTGVLIEGDVIYEGLWGGLGADYVPVYHCGNDGSCMSGCRYDHWAS